MKALGKYQRDKSEATSFRELVYNLLGNIKHSRRNYEDHHRKRQYMAVSPKCLTNILLTQMFNLDLLRRQASLCHRTSSRTTVLNSSTVSTSWQPEKVRVRGEIVFSTLGETKETGKPDVTCDLWRGPWSKVSAASFQMFLEKLCVYTSLDIYIYIYREREIQKGGKNINSYWVLVKTVQVLAVQLINFSVDKTFSKLRTWGKIREKEQGD